VIAALLLSPRNPLKIPFLFKNSEEGNIAHGNDVLPFQLDYCSSSSSVVVEARLCYSPRNPSSRRAHQVKSCGSVYRFTAASW